MKKFGREKLWKTEYRKSIGRYYLFFHLIAFK